MEVTQGESWEQRDARLRDQAIVLTDSPVKINITSQVDTMHTKVAALLAAYSAGALSRDMLAKAIRELELTHRLHDGIILEENSEVTTDSSRGEEEVDDDDRSWFLVLESNDENHAPVSL